MPDLAQMEAALKQIQKIVSEHTAHDVDRLEYQMSRIWDAVDYGLYGQVYENKS